MRAITGTLDRCGTSFELSATDEEVGGLGLRLHKTDKHLAYMASAQGTPQRHPTEYNSEVKMWFGD